MDTLGARGEFHPGVHQVKRLADLRPVRVGHCVVGPDLGWPVDDEVVLADLVADRPLGRRGEVITEGKFLLDGAVRDLDRLRIRDPGEGLLRDREVDPQVCQVLAAGLRDVVIDVDYQIFEEFHDVVMIGK